MSRIKASTSEDLIHYAVGLGGNLYVWSCIKSLLVTVCLSIEKSPKSIYFSDKHECWVFRIKSKKHKTAFREYAEEEL